jgi:putative SOS response-associated peptidase YedK
MESIHNRMPVILPEQAYASWLNPDLNNTVYLRGLMGSYNSEEMEAYPVSPMVNNPRNDQPECAIPVQ